MPRNDSRAGCVAIPAVAAATLYSKPAVKTKSEWASWTDRRRVVGGDEIVEPPVAQPSPASAVEARRS